MARGTGVVEMQCQIGRRHAAGAALRPLDEQQGVGVEKVADADEFEFFGIGEPVQIEVIRRATRQRIRERAMAAAATVRDYVQPSTAQTNQIVNYLIESNFWTINEFKFIPCMTV